MDARLQMEISPGTITFATCPTCGNEAIQFDAVAINGTGVGYVGTIRRCTTCTEEPC